MAREVHVFENGVKVYDDHLTPGQRERYREQNVHEAEEEGIFLEIVDSIPRDGCLVNVGSAVGYYVILAKKQSGDLALHAVEPLATHRRYFAENVVLNGLSPDDFRLYREGVSRSNGYSLFLDKDYGSSILRSQGQATSFRSRLQAAGMVLLALLRMKGYGIVRTITLDKLMDRVGRPADLLQMGGQGLEADVLSGGRRSLEAGRVRTFLVGTHGRELHQQCVEILTECGYSIEFENAETKHQPDGILVASKGVRRLAVQDRGT